MLDLDLIVRAQGASHLFPVKMEAPGRARATPWVIGQAARTRRRIMAVKRLFDAGALATCPPLSPLPLMIH